MQLLRDFIVTNSSTILIVVLGLLLVQLLTIAFLIYQYWQYTRVITQAFLSSREQGVMASLKEYLTAVDRLRAGQQRLDEDLRQLIRQGTHHFQKVALIRFNPFSDTGSDQSFSIALLDGENSGFVLTSLHGRDLTRIYAKPIVEGQASGFQLSKEEKEAVIKAIQE